MTEGGRFVELQGTAEGAAFDSRQLDRLLDTARAGGSRINALQKKILGSWEAPK